MDSAIRYVQIQSIVSMQVRQKVNFLHWTCKADKSLHFATECVYGHAPPQDLTMIQIHTLLALSLVSTEAI